MLLPVPYLTSCAFVMSSLYCSYSLITVLNELDVQKLLVQILCQYRLKTVLCPYLVVYIVSKNLPIASILWHASFVSSLHKLQNRRTIHCRMFMNACSMYWASPSILEVVSYISNVRMHCAMATVASCNMDGFTIISCNCELHLGP